MGSSLIEKRSDRRKGIRKKRSQRLKEKEEKKQIHNADTSLPRLLLVLSCAVGKEVRKKERKRNKKEKVQVSLHLRKHEGCLPDDSMKKLLSPAFLKEFLHVFLRIYLSTSLPSNPLFLLWAHAINPVVVCVVVFTSFLSLSLSCMQCSRKACSILVSLLPRPMLVAAAVGEPGEGRRERRVFL